MRRALIAAAIVGIPILLINLGFQQWLLQTMNENAAKRGIEHVLQTNISVTYHDHIMKKLLDIENEIQSFQDSNATSR